MFGKSFSFLAIGVLLLTGCAEPKYLNRVETSSPQENSQKTQECSVVFSNSQLCLQWFWETKPTSKEYGSLIFKIFRLNSYDNTPVASEIPGAPQVVLWMPSMGHGSTPTVTEKLDTGTYRVKDVFFIMPGDWDILFQFQDSSEKTLDEAKVSLIF